MIKTLDKSEIRKVIFFDIDGTLLVDPCGFPRLPIAAKNLWGISIPNDYWPKLAGSTELAVARQVVCDFKIGDKFSWLIQAVELIKEMDNVYLSGESGKKMPEVYPHTIEGLDRLKARGYRLGILTGRSDSTGIEVLKRAKIYDRFDHDHLFWGWENKYANPVSAQEHIDRFKSRSAVLTEAWLSTFGMHAQIRPPLVYVADTLRDFQESYGIREHLRSIDVKVLLRSKEGLMSAVKDEAEGHYREHLFKISYGFFHNSVGDSSFREEFSRLVYRSFSDPEYEGSRGIER